jgi:hypothetical protein
VEPPMNAIAAVTDQSISRVRSCCGCAADCRPVRVARRLERRNIAGSRSLVVAGECLQIVVTKG